jgi:hypothetical protein
MAIDKQVVVSFRVDSHLAEMLSRLPDKSGFIRDAVLKRFYDVCPLCQGHGVLPGIVAGWWTKRVAETNPRKCRCCGYEFPAELANTRGKRSKKTAFLCPHCAEHEHSH